MTLKIGTDEEFLAATVRAPEDLSDRDLAIVESTHPQMAKTMREDRARALAKRAAAERTALQKIAAAHASRPSVAVPVSLASQLSKELSPFLEGESLSEWVNRQNPTIPAPMALVGALLTFALNSNEKNVGRNARLDELERRCAELESQLALAAEHVKDLEARSADAVPYKGIWSAEETYNRGVFVTHGGSLWHSASASRGRRPGTDPSCWTLAVKRGADGKNAQ